jgi:hypothetical protein
MLVSKTALAGIAAIAGVGFLTLSAPAQAAASSASKECSAQYQAAKKAGTLNGQKWPQFYSDCAAKMKGDDSAAEDASSKSKKETKSDSAMAPKTKETKPTKETKASDHQTTQQICSEQYQAAKSAGTLGGKKWSQFYSDCAADIRDDKSDTAETPDEPKVEKTATTTKYKAPTVDKNGKPLSPGQIAFRQRIHECSVEWQRDKAADRLRGQKWPQYWSACNTRLKQED